MAGRPAAGGFAVSVSARAPRVLIVPSWYPDTDDPIRGVFIRDQADVLAESLPVAVIAPRVRGWRHAFSSGESIVISHERGYPEIRPTALMPPRAHQPVASYRAFRRAFQAGLQALAEAWGAPDVVHAHVVLPAGWAAAAVVADRIPIVLSEHSGPFSVHTARPDQRDLVVRALDSAAAITAVSRSLAATLDEAARALGAVRLPPIDVVGNVVRTETFTLGPAAGRPTPGEFVAVAMLDKVKGVDVLLEAVALAVPRLEELHVTIIGDGPERAALEAQAAELGISQTVRFAGALERAEVVAHLHRAVALVSPSRLETFGLAVAEAMACGKPVIATRSGGPQELVTPDSGILVGVEAPDQLADAMVAMAGSADSYDAAGIRASVVERFGEGAFTERMIALYRRVLESR